MVMRKRISYCWNGSEEMFKSFNFDEFLIWFGSKNVNMGQMGRKFLVDWNLNLSNMKMSHNNW